MCQKLLSDVKFHQALLHFDEELSEHARQGGCLTCESRLHRANYPRKPRGAPPGLSSRSDVRFSLCCAKEGCRKRRTPPSIRFLGRRVYLGVIVVLACALEHGVTPWRISQLREELQVSRRTVVRWCQWWQEHFPRSEFWRVHRGHFPAGLDEHRIPGALLDFFEGEERDRMLLLLKFLSPLSTSPASGGMAF